MQSFLVIIWLSIVIYGKVDQIKLRFWYKKHFLNRKILLNKEILTYLIYLIELFN